MPDSSHVKDGPFLSVACLCEKILEEKDGVKSAIRIVDRVTRTAAMPEPPEEMEPWQYSLKLLIKLKSGAARGVHSLGVQMIKPSQERMPLLTNSVFFEGDEDRGIDVVADMNMMLDQTGVYWFYITLNGNILTKIPMRVIYMPQIITPPPMTSSDQAPRPEDPPQK